MIALLALLGWAVALAAEPGDQTVIYYNARMALREDRPTEAVKLWMLRNVVEQRTQQLSPFDADFRSTTWAALGDLGLCPDGYAADDDGAGLWPVSMHNWLVANANRRRSKAPRPFAAFQVGRQHRRVSLGDVLGSAELDTLELESRRCWWPRQMLMDLGHSPLAKFTDKEVVVDLQLYLLNRAERTLADDRVVGRSVIEARRFDLYLQRMEIARREAELEARQRARRGKEVGLARPSVAAMNEEAPEFAFSAGSLPAAILRASVTWPPSEWMALSPDRRLFLFDQAKAYGGDPAALDVIVLGIVDALLSSGEGAQIDAWIARLSGPAARPLVWDGERGQRLLSLDREAGFGERAPLALHRAVSQLQAGDLRAALRSFAYALQEAPDSRVSDETASLSRRWLSYAMAQFESTSELLITLRELVPARDYAIILEDLMWRAALRADLASFERGLASRSGRGGAALDRRLALLRPLAAGNLKAFEIAARSGLASSPSEALRFLEQLIEQIELEDADVRAAHAPTLARIEAMVLPLTVPATGGTAGRQTRTATALLERIQAIQEGQLGLGPDATAQDRARALAPTGEVFAGSVRLAPADPLPWPFAASDVDAPSTMLPITLTPREWQDAAGELVFGWSLGG